MEGAPRLEQSHAEGPTRGEGKGTYAAVLKGLDDAENVRMVVEPLKKAHFLVRGAPLVGAHLGNLDLLHHILGTCASRGESVSATGA